RTGRATPPAVRSIHPLARHVKPVWVRASQDNATRPTSSLMTKLTIALTVRKAPRATGAKPQDRAMAVVMPMLTAPPRGIEFATALPARLRLTARREVRPGSDDV